MKLITTIISMLLITSCSIESNDKNLEYKNLIILSDMSSRIKNKPLKDINKIKKIINFFRDKCVMPGEKIGDKSSILFSTFSSNDFISVDLSKIKNIGEKQSFINSTGKYIDNGLDRKLSDFENKIDNSYDSIKDDGLDLISLLLDKIHNTDLIKNEMHFTDGLNKTNIKYDNHVYIFTDGYLEYKGKSLNNQFFYGNNEINAVREYCIKNKVDIIKALDSNKSFCLPVTKIMENPQITLHIMETHERDKNTNFLTYSNPTGQRDNEILEAVWRKWAVESGFKNLIWEKY